jgi:phosphoglycerol transferase MdoB-like AlkP superfamily enzyme
MKTRVWLLVKTFLLFLAFFMVMKPVFMIYNHSIYHFASFTDYCQVILHGFTLDMSVAGYSSAIPGILLVLSVFLHRELIQLLQKIYFIIVSILLSLIYVVDMVLYGYWGFRIDSTPIYNFLSSPKDALVSVSIWIVILGFIFLGVISYLLYLMFYHVLIRKENLTRMYLHKYETAGVLVLCLGLLFLPIRGGLSASTMNVGKAYYSINEQMNHAAINPCFSFFNSFFHEMNTNQYRYFKPEVAEKYFSQMTDKSDGGPDTQSILQNRRPNVVVVVLESFSYAVMKTMGGEANVATNMDKFTDEGIFFSNFYANSFRSDRGLAAILAGYPGQPTTSIMKFPRMTEKLPMFPKEMRRAGYDLQYYYGGDADFTNTRSFLVNAGFDKIVCDRNFSLVQRKKSKWGAPDEIVYDRMLNDIKQYRGKQPFLKIMKSLSSHEPFDVPHFHRLKDLRLNSFAYADSCLGDFIRKMETLPVWKNTLVILVADHQGVYPPDIDNYSFERYHIPLILLGGALIKPMKVTTYGSQIDISATLLSQLGISHRAFTFSKDLFNPKSPHFGYSTFPNAFSMVSPEDSVFFNCETNSIIKDRGVNKGKNLNYGKAFLQKLYEDLSKR